MSFAPTLHQCGFVQQRGRFFLLQFAHSSSFGFPDLLQSVMVRRLRVSFYYQSHIIVIFKILKTILKTILEFHRTFSVYRPPSWFRV